MTPEGTLALHAVTRHGIRLAARLAGALTEATTLYVNGRFLAEAPAGARPLRPPYGAALTEVFHQHTGHVFFVSIGAVVRLLAPVIRDKKVDPGVVCVDDAGRFAVAVLSGHLGGGNALAYRVAAALGATPVVTTASDSLGTIAVDLMGRELGWQLDDLERNVTRACAAMVNGEPVAIVQETGESHWWPLDRPLPANVRYVADLDAVDPRGYAALIVISDRDVRRTHPEHWRRAVIHRPRSLALGVGCDRHTPPTLVKRGLERLFAVQGLALASIRVVATIDRKADEPAIRELAADLGVPLATYPAAELDRVEGIENPSEIVRRYVGTWGVAEPAALLAAGASRLLVPKWRYTEPGAGRSATFAVARIPFPPRQEQTRGGSA